MTDLQSGENVAQRTALKCPCRVRLAGGLNKQLRYCLTVVAVVRSAEWKYVDWV